ncbi:hypothetical protein [Massilia antarctica]|uniref:hypothetical protein n=1 Tax=Massilia antarctica TaxID=2765360 RepID=UPI0006BB7E79|nr:hypothetical protein [Massilia sp. H27-R4]MCY0915432.1 hypothetical protein [Massilia sp. H27-R4]CUI05896.1 hypothetical protein BN2497_6569 [Janthinobacterium sp. CG23_2]CUU29682.1 hypothetical protein BN3177_6569 [Janthinobacterium sp. CG23_2]
MISIEQTVELNLTTPLDNCCNCGATGGLNLYQTPLRRTRFMLFVGTQLTLLETFPYCPKCKASAPRLRKNLMSKLLAACMVCAALFLILVLSASGLPKFVAENLFYAAVIGAAIATGVYFYLREKEGGERSYYQPVSLADVDLDFRSGAIECVTLKLRNAAYARVLAKANAETMRVGMLKIDVRM